MDSKERSFCPTQNSFLGDADIARRSYADRVLQLYFHSLFLRMISGHVAISWLFLAGHSGPYFVASKSPGPSRFAIAVFLAV